RSFHQYQFSLLLHLEFDVTELNPKPASPDTMEICKEDLPVELHYLIPIAEAHGDEARVHEFDESLGRHVSYGEKVSDEVVAELRDLYLEIVEKDHAKLINEWHDKNWDKCPDTAWPVYGVLFLFSQLAERGIEPFCDRRVQPSE
ncbi:MAG: hypothetical protein MI757_05105, partial [Pirellulales bacterium]|nr:hypothetical protein [Pirellulales bacterium]